MKLNARHFWMLVGATAVMGLAGACSDDASNPINSAGAGGKGGQATAGKGGQASGGKGGKGGQANGGAGNEAGIPDQAGSAGDLTGGAPDMGGAAGEAGTGGEPAVVKSCAVDNDCTPGICNANVCAAAECSVTNDCSATTACKAGRCLACTTVSIPFKYHPPGAAPTAVYLAGDFNGFAAANAGYKLTAETNGDFTISIPLAPGSYKYKFVVDGTYTQDTGNPRSADDGFGGLNSVDVVNCHGIVPPECLADQDCSGGKICKTYACVAPECTVSQDCGNVDLACGAGHCVPATCNHTFTYAGAATTVYVAGDFTNPQWDPMVSGWNLTQTSASVWSKTFPLTAGPHEYKLVIDGNWILDPANSAQKDTNSYIADSCAPASGGSGGLGGGGGSGG